MKTAKSRVWVTASSAPDFSSRRDCRHCKSAPPFSPCRAARGCGLGARGRYQRLARCPQLAGIPGMGALDHRMEGRNHLRTGRGATHSPGPGLKLCRVSVCSRPHGRPGRRKLWLTISARATSATPSALPLGAVRLTNEFLHHRSAPQGGATTTTRICRTGNRPDCHRITNPALKSSLRPQARPLRWRRSVMVFTGLKAREHPVQSPEPRCAASPNCWRVIPSARTKQLRRRTATRRNRDRRRGGLLRTARALPAGGLPLFAAGIARRSAGADGGGIRRSTRSGKHIQSERWDSIKAAVAHYRVDMNHALQVRNRPCTCSGA